MKNIVLSAVAVLAMSSFAVAGGDIAPVEEPVVVVEEPVSTGAFYLGLAYGAANHETSYERTDDIKPSIVELGRISTYTEDYDYSTIMLQAGYKFNPYIAIEGRYWFGLEDTVTTWGGDADLSIDTWGIYVKPMYPVTDAFDIYALLGYASSEVTLDYENWTYEPDYDIDGFSWGIGAAYSFNDNLSIFVDYVNMYDDEVTIDFLGGSETYEDVLSTWNFGVTYTF